MRTDEFGERISPSTIEMQSLRLRALLGVGDAWTFNIVEKIENELPKFIPDFALLVKESSEISNKVEFEGQTFHSPPRIVLPEHIYLGALASRPRDRFTLAHELGHFVLHPTGNHARIKNSSRLIRSSAPGLSKEAQADYFAGAFLMSEIAMREFSSPQEAAQNCNVSEAAAEVRMRQLRLWPKKSEAVVKGFEDLLSFLGGDNPKRK